jgi:hypothetical protein
MRSHKKEGMGKNIIIIWNNRESEETSKMGRRQAGKEMKVEGIYPTYMSEFVTSVLTRSMLIVSGRYTYCTPGHTIHHTYAMLCHYFILLPECVCVCVCVCCTCLTRSNNNNKVQAFFLYPSLTLFYLFIWSIVAFRIIPYTVCSLLPLSSRGPSTFSCSNVQIQGRVNSFSPDCFI